MDWSSSRASPVRAWAPHRFASLRSVPRNRDPLQSGGAGRFEGPDSVPSPDSVLLDSIHFAGQKGTEAPLTASACETSVSLMPADIDDPASSRPVAPPSQRPSQRPERVRRPPRPMGAMTSSQPQSSRARFRGDCFTSRRWTSSGSPAASRLGK